MRPLAQSSREQNSFLKEEPHGSGCATQALEGGKDHAKCGLHLRVRVEGERVVGQVDQAHRRTNLQLAAALMLAQWTDSNAGRSYTFEWRR